MHGGSAGSGAQPNNTNRLVHGGYTRAALERRALLRLVEAADAALMAELRVAGLVARGETNVDQAVKAAAEKQQWLRRAAEATQQFLLRVGRSDEAGDLASEIAALTSP